MKLIVFTTILWIVFSCQKQSDQLVSTDEEAVELDSSHPERQEMYNQSKTINGYTIAVTYLLTGERDDGTSVQECPTDQSLHFLMEIEADGQDRTGNFLYHEVYDASDFTANVNYFNFEIVNDVSVEVDDYPYQVVLSNMENTYTLDDKRKIHFVAVPLEKSPLQKQGQRISFVYDDTVLGVGKTKFIFNTQI